MNISFGEVNSIQEIISIAIVSLIVAIPSMLSVRNHRQLRKLDGQVANGHGTPLRLDIDEIRNTLGHIRNDIHHVRTEIADVRNDLNDERRERAHLATKVEKLS